MLINIGEEAEGEAEEEEEAEERMLSHNERYTLEVKSIVSLISKQVDSGVHG